MSISSVSSSFSPASPLSASAAVGTQNSVLQTAVGDRTVKDKIDLSKEAISLLAGPTPAAG